MKCTPRPLGVARSRVADGEGLQISNKQSSVASNCDCSLGVAPVTNDLPKCVFSVMQGHGKLHDLNSSPLFRMGGACNAHGEDEK